MSKSKLKSRLTPNNWHLVFLTIIILLSGCGRIQNERFTNTQDEIPSDINLELELANSGALNTAQAAELSISLTQKGEPVADATIDVEGNMNHAGMEPILITAEEVQAGEYRATLNWTMGGGWLITVRATLPDGTQVEKVMDNLQVDSE